MKDERKKGDRTIKRSFTLGPGDAYLFSDKYSKKNGWTWIEKWSMEPHRIIMMNPGTKTIFTFCEGDLTWVTADNQEAFVDEIKEASQFYARY